MSDYASDWIRWEVWFRDDLIHVTYWRYDPAMTDDMVRSMIDDLLRRMGTMSGLSRLPAVEGSPEHDHAPVVTAVVATIDVDAATVAYAPIRNCQTCLDFLAGLATRVIVAGPGVVVTRW